MTRFAESTLTNLIRDRSSTIAPSSMERGLFRPPATHTRRIWRSPFSRRFVATHARTPASYPLRHDDTLLASRGCRIRLGVQHAVRFH